MGSYNVTCGISNLPINGGDKVKLFILVKSDWEAYGSGQSGITDLWFPRGFPITGEYNDYGSLENSSIENTLSTEILFLNLQKDFSKNNKPNSFINFIDNISYYKIHDGESEREKNKVYEPLTPLTDEQKRRIHSFFKKYKETKVQREIEDQELLNNIKEVIVPEVSIPDPRDSSEYIEDRPVHRLGFMFVLDSVYQALINHDEELHNKLVSFSKEWYNDALLNIKERKVKSYSINIKEIAEYSTKAYGNLFTQFARMDPTFRKAIYYYLEFLIHKMNSNIPFEDSDVQFIINQFIEFYKFKDSMIALRKGWAPPFGAGQSNETTHYKILANAMLKVCDERDKRAKEWY